MSCGGRAMMMLEMQKGKCFTSKQLGTSFSCVCVFLLQEDLKTAHQMKGARDSRCLFVCLCCKTQPAERITR